MRAQFFDTTRDLDAYAERKSPRYGLGERPARDGANVFSEIIMKRMPAVHQPASLRALAHLDQMVAKLRLHGPLEPVERHVDVEADSVKLRHHRAALERAEVAALGLARARRVLDRRVGERDLAGGDLRLERRGLALGAGRVVLVEAEEDVRLPPSASRSAPPAPSRSILCCVDDLAEIVEEPGDRRRRAPRADRAARERRRREAAQPASSEARSEARIISDLLADDSEIAELTRRGRDDPRLNRHRLHTARLGSPRRSQIERS